MENILSEEGDNDKRRGDYETCILGVDWSSTCPHLTVVPPRPGIFRPAEAMPADAAELL